tara:strand:- start:414 stop:620 length:207 start_codon:yes stop_codon:yes gene_type:complete
MPDELLVAASCGVSTTAIFVTILGRTMLRQSVITIRPPAAAAYSPHARRITLELAPSSIAWMMGACSE